MKKNEFRETMATIREESSGKSRLGRICPDRLIPDVNAFFDENERLCMECDAERDGWLMDRFCWLVSFVVDIFTDSKKKTVSNSDFALFKKYMAVLAKLREEVVECYKGNGKSMKDMTHKVCCFWEIIQSSSKWCLYRNYTLFHDAKYTFEVFKRLNADWDVIENLVGDITEMVRNFCKYAENQHKLELNYDEGQLYDIFCDILDGKKKFSGEIKIYKCMGTIRTVVDANESGAINYAFLVPNDQFYKPTFKIQISTIAEIPGMGQENE
ncbi:MAG: hypothetical protein IKE91_07160 [Clostridia bacterium]|nr:hypothetical protein [Clostridia bacterium]